MLTHTLFIASLIADSAEPFMALYAVIIIVVAVVAYLLYELMKRSRKLRYRDQQLRMVRKEVDALRSEIRELNLQSRSDDVTSRDAAEQELLETSADDIFEEYVDDSMTHSDRAFLKRLTGYIEQNIDSSDLVVNSLCDFMGVTPLVLNKKLKMMVNMTANVFIRTIRLRRAAALLRTARYTVSDVTYDVGFSDLRYFRECFKREFGLLPQEYKDQNASKSVRVGSAKGDEEVVAL